MSEHIGKRIREHYEEFIKHNNPANIARWPIIAGLDAKVTTFDNRIIVLAIHTGNKIMFRGEGLDPTNSSIVGATSLDSTTKETVRRNLERFYNLNPFDAVFIFDADNTLPESEFERAYQKHQTALGLSPMKIFLSHKTIDKPLVNDYKETLDLLGYDTWLDTDAMTAGANPTRAIMEGIENSCATVFFITPNFTDEKWLAEEIDQSIARKREQGERFSIITLVFKEPNKPAPGVPKLLRRYIYKEPTSPLNGLREIIRALPIMPGAVHWR